MEAFVFFIAAGVTLAGACGVVFLGLEALLARTNLCGNRDRRQLGDRRWNLEALV